MITWVWQCGTTARVWAGWAGCREHCHAFPESSSGLSSTVEASSYWTLARCASFLCPFPCTYSSNSSQKMATGRLHHEQGIFGWRHLLTAFWVDLLLLVRVLVCTQTLEFKVSWETGVSLDNRPVKAVYQVAIWIQREWKTGMDRSLTKVISIFLPFFLFDRCLPTSYAILRVPPHIWLRLLRADTSIQTYIVSCTAGARAIFWFLLVVRQWNYVKRVSSVWVVFRPMT